MQFAVGKFIARPDSGGVAHGFVHIKRLSDLPVGATTGREARVAAGYLSKYVTKTFDPGERPHLLELHPYKVAQGFQPPVVRLAGRSSWQELARPPLCRRHHRLKTHTAWTYDTLDVGIHLWHSPHGRHYRRDPHGTTTITGPPG